MTRVSVVLFDLDDTLFAHSEAVRAGVTAHRRTFAPGADDAAEFARWHALEEHHYHRYLAGELGFHEQRRARARGFVEPYGIDLSSDERADAWFNAYLAEYRSAWRLHDDALACLDELASRGIRMGVITNAELQFQLTKLDALELTARMEHIVASGEVGAAKPDARIFEHAVELFGVAPEHAMYVGDRLETDAVGAALAGLSGVWLDRSGSASAADAASAAQANVRVIRTLAEVAALV